MRVLQSLLLAGTLSAGLAANATDTPVSAPNAAFDPALAKQAGADRRGMREPELHKRLIPPASP